MKFRYKICFAVRILCLANICADGSTASADLIGDNRFSFSLSDFTRLIICTAKSMDCVLNLLSDIFTPPAAQTLYYKRFSFSIFREVWLRQVKQRRCRCEVSCSHTKCTSLAKHTSRSAEAEHFARKEPTLAVDKCGFFSGAPSRI